MAPPHWSRGAPWLWVLPGSPEQCAPRLTSPASVQTTWYFSLSLQYYSSNTVCLLAVGICMHIPCSLPLAGKFLAYAGRLVQALALWHPGLPGKQPGELQDQQCDWLKVLRRAIRSKIIKEKATIFKEFRVLFNRSTKIQCQVFCLLKSALSRDMKVELFFFSFTSMKENKEEDDTQVLSPSRGAVLVTHTVPAGISFVCFAILVL